MTDQQREALYCLRDGIHQAANAGLLDNFLNVYVHPDTINQFCDGVNDLIQSEFGMVVE